MAHLSDDHRRLIELEEQYRHDIRQQLESEGKFSGGRSQRLLEFFNSALGLFLLSTVFVSAFSAVFTWAIAAHHTATERRERQRHLTVEVSSRINELGILTTPFPAQYRDVLKTAFFGFHAGDTQNPSWKLYYAPIFPEYRERSLYSLLWELEDLTKKEDRPAIRLLLSQVRPASAYLDRLILQTAPPPPHSADKEVREFYVLTPSDQDSVRRHLNVLAHFVQTHRSQ